LRTAISSMPITCGAGVPARLTQLHTSDENISMDQGIMSLDLF
jgi:hypothetical protein